MTTLVTGGTGFVGAPAVEVLAERGDDVHVLARRAASAPVEGVTYHAVDFLDADDRVRALIRELRPDRLLHLAWITTPGAYWTSLDNLRWVGASLAMFEEFAESGGRRAVCAGTSAEYDWSYDVLHELETPTRPATLYGAAKHALHVLVDAAAHQTGTSVAWARLFFLYGPNEQAGRLVSSVLAALRAGEPAPVSDGTQERDFLHVDDAARALVELLDADVVGPVNVASGRGVSVRELVATLAELQGRPDLVQYGARPSDPNEPRRLIADVGRLHAATGFLPRFDLRTGLADLLTRSRNETECPG